MLSMSFRPTRAKSGVTGPSHRLDWRGRGSGPARGSSGSAPRRPFSPPRRSSGTPAGRRPRSSRRNPSSGSDRRQRGLRAGRVRGFPDRGRRHGRVPSMELFSAEPPDALPGTGHDTPALQHRQQAPAAVSAGAGEENERGIGISCIARRRSHRLPNPRLRYLREYQNFLFMNALKSMIMKFRVFMPLSLGISILCAMNVIVSPSLLLVVPRVSDTITSTPFH